MLIIYQSNNFETLLKQACQIIKNKPLSNPMKNELFIVNNTTIEQWIKIFIAKYIGIYANIKFDQCENFIWKIFTYILPKYTNQYSFTHLHILWKILSIPKLNNYLMNHNSNTKNEKFQFAFTMSKIFNQYLIYRPEWIELWDNNTNIPNLSKEQKWQKKLWRSILYYSKKNNQNIHHFSNIKKKIIQKITNNTSIIKQILPIRIFIFNTIYIPNTYIEILNHISKICKIYILNIKNTISTNKSILNISKNHHPLLSYSQNIILNHIQYLYSFQHKNKTIFSKIQGNNLLQKIQKKILFYSTNINIKQKQCNNKYGEIFYSTDNSISIHICNSIRQEIEILHYNLLNIFHKNNTINPKDIIVLSTNISIYIPFIRSVFNSVPKKYFIPFSISNSSTIINNSILQILNKLFNIINIECNQEEILSLLSFPILLERFNINEIEFKILKQWIQKANIKLGINKQHLYELFNIKTNYNNWNFGINNMLLSYSVNENNFIWNNNVSYNEFHHEHAELIAKIQEFIILLNKWKKIFLYSNNLIIWKTKFKKMIKDFFSTKYLHHEFILFLQDTWNKIINDGIKSKFKKKINIKILKNIFLKQVQKRNYHSNLCIGSINFCNIDTLENISFKMIYLLGINENIYPRKTNEKFFNLITHKLKIGDINYRMYDFHMFYNCLFNAKQYFYISYINNHSSDSNTINSSIVIEILQKYIINNFKIMTHDINLIQSETTIENQKKIINHLYHFHPITIYNKNNKLFCCKNYKKLDHDVIIEKKYNQINNINNNSCNNIYTTINVQDLIKFWKHPIRFFFNHTLKVKIPYLQKNESELNYFYINPIHIYQMKSEILDSLIYKKNINYLHILYSQSGILPYGNFGKHIWEQMIIEMHDLYKKIYLLRDKPNRKKICMTINSYQLQNYQLSEIHKIGLIRWKPNIIYIPDIISLWIEHLIYCYLQGNGMSYVLGTKNSCSFSTVSVQTAKKYLNMYITGYIKGISQPLLLTKSGITWLLSQYNNNNNIIFNNNLDYQKSNKQFFNIWNGNTINDGEKQDFYINKIIPNLDQSIFLKLCNTAKKWFLPILHYYKKNNLQ